MNTDSRLYCFVCEGIRFTHAFDVYGNELLLCLDCNTAMGVFEATVNDFYTVDELLSRAGLTPIDTPLPFDD